LALLVPTSGPYVAAYSPRQGTVLLPGSVPGPTSLYGAVGLCRRGWDLLWHVHDHRVDDTTSWARTLIELLYLGADWFLRAQALEYFAAGIPGALTLGVAPGGLPEVAWPYGANGPGLPAGGVGNLFSAVLDGVGARGSTETSGTLLLSAVSGTPAATSPASLTAGHAVNGLGSINMDSRLRECQLNLRLLPYSTPAPDVVTTADENVPVAPSGDDPKDLSVASTAGAAASGVGTYISNAVEPKTVKFSYDGITADQVLNIPDGNFVNMVPIARGDTIILPSASETNQWFTTT
jgi:hypothetical protein